MKLYPTRPYASAAEVQIGDVVRMRHTGELHGGISPAFDDAIVIELIPSTNPADLGPFVRLCRPHMRIVNGAAIVEMERFSVEIGLFVQRFDVCTRGASGDIDNRVYETGRFEGSFWRLGFFRLPEAP